MSTSLGARVVTVEPSLGEVRRAPRRWPDSTPPPTIRRRTVADVATEIAIVERSAGCRFAKRGFDIVGAALGLLLLSPLLIALAAAIRLSSKGPALFVQDRVGLGGRVFRFYKFRTMVCDAEQRKADLAHLNEMSGPVFKIKRDPRITRIGALLRKTSLDELPQLWNILKGDMSLVGPRPPLPTEVELYTPLHAQRLGIVPGLTGLWQVSGRNAIPDFDSWVRLDLEYAQRWSFWLDIKILLKTVLVVVQARGAQ